jgi:hypothetical protein
MNQSFERYLNTLNDNQRFIVKKLVYADKNLIDLDNSIIKDKLLQINKEYIHYLNRENTNLYLQNKLMLTAILLFTFSLIVVSIIQ